MGRTVANDDRNPGSTRARGQHWTDRLARFVWLVLLGATALALLGGAIAAATWRPDATAAPVSAEVCADPPCFGGGGLPGVRDLPVVLPILGYLVAIGLGLPSLLVGAWDCLRGRGAVGVRRLLPFVGPVLVLVGAEIVPHVASPCTAAWVLGSDLPGICERTVHGVDIADRWHALDHALVGALPLAALYSLALRRWHPVAR